MKHFTISTSKKDLIQLDDNIPRLIEANSPANILKCARESLKELDTNRPFSIHKRPRPHIKLPSSKVFGEEVSTAKLRPYTKEDFRESLENLQPNRARSAYGSRNTPLDENLSLKGGICPAGKKKSIFSFQINTQRQEGYIDSGSTEVSSPKPLKTFIIKHKKLDGRNNTTDLGELLASPTNVKFVRRPSKFSTYKTDSVKIEPLGNLEQEVVEERKSDLDIIGRNLNAEEDYACLKNENSTTSGSKGEAEGKNNEEQPELTESPVLMKEKSKRNSVILRKDSQVNFNVKVGEVLGEGAYGVVYKALNMETGQFLAVKHIKVHDLQNKSSVGLDNFCQEIEVYQKLEHENIVSYLGAKQDNDDIYIYMEYMPGGSISSMLSQYGLFEEKVIRKFTKQVLKGLHYLHGKGVIHRDVKGGNILSDGSGKVKLADFGASKHIDNVSFASSVTNSQVCDSIKGSLFWMAPELLNQEKHGRKIDIWSLGCTVIEMATGKHPWSEVKSLPELIITVMTKRCPPIPEHLSECAKDFIRQCCQFDKRLRPITDELLIHPFLNEDI